MTIPGLLKSFDLIDGYVLRQVGELADPDKLSDQCRAVRKILLDGQLDGMQRLNSLSTYLGRCESVELDTARWLYTFLRASNTHQLVGHAKQLKQYYEVDAPDFEVNREARQGFWEQLSDRFRDSACFLCALADEHYWKGRLGELPVEDEVAFSLYDRAFQIDPLLTLDLSYPQDKEWQQVGGQLWLRFRLAKMKAHRCRWQLAMMVRIAEQLRAEFYNDPDVMSDVDATLGDFADLVQSNRAVLLANHRGRTLQSHQQYVQAIDAYDEALRIDPDYAKAHLGRGHCRGCLDSNSDEEDYVQGFGLQHHRFCEKFGVDRGDERTTPQPAVDLLSHIPELADHAATTVRLHARYGTEPEPDESKLGGLFLWPMDEPWPVCEEHQIPYATLLQLRAEDFPEIEFFPDTDLFQLLWCPQDHEIWIKPAVVWRKRSDIVESRPDNPKPLPLARDLELVTSDYPLDEEYLNRLPPAMREMLLAQAGGKPRRVFTVASYVPTPCRLLPERVTELPYVEDLMPDMQERIRNVLALESLPESIRNATWAHRAIADYEASLSVCKGSKIGGYVDWVQGPEIPLCDCGRQMEHLLTLASDECDGASYIRWLPEEEQNYWTGYQNDAITATTQAHGMQFGDLGKIYFFICHYCQDWPVRHVGQCS